MPPTCGKSRPVLICQGPRVSPETAALLTRIADALERLAPPPPPRPDFGIADTFVWRAEKGAPHPVQNVNRVDLSLLRGIDRARDALMENFYNRKATPFDRSIDMHVSHLRRKLEGDTPLIKTIRGVGYIFARPREKAKA